MQFFLFFFFFWSGFFLILDPNMIHKFINGRTAPKKPRADSLNWADESYMFKKAQLILL